MGAHACACRRLGRNLFRSPHNPVRELATRTTCSLKGDSPYGLKDGKPFLCFVQSVEHAADLEPQQLDFSTWRDVVKDGYVPDATTHMPTQDAAPVPRLRLAWH